MRCARTYPKVRANDSKVRANDTEKARTVDFRSRCDAKRSVLPASGRSMRIAITDDRVAGSGEIARDRSGIRDQKMAFWDEKTREKPVLKLSQFGLTSILKAKIRLVATAIIDCIALACYTLRNGSRVASVAKMEGMSKFGSLGVEDFFRNRSNRHSVPSL